MAELAGIEITFAANVRIAREGLGWTQGMVARQMKWRRHRWLGGTVSDVERCLRHVTLSEAASLAEVFGFTLATLSSSPAEMIRAKIRSRVAREGIR